MLCSSGSLPQLSLLPACSCNQIQAAVRFSLGDCLTKQHPMRCGDFNWIQADNIAPNTLEWILQFFLAVPSSVKIREQVLLAVLDIHARTLHSPCLQMRWNHSDPEQYFSNLFPSHHSGTRWVSFAHRLIQNTKLYTWIISCSKACVFRPTLLK